MKKHLFHFAFIVMFFGILVTSKKVSADYTCYNQRRVDQNICVPSIFDGSCVDYVVPCIGTALSGVSNLGTDAVPSASSALIDCESKCGGPYAGHCGVAYCAAYSTTETATCTSQSFIAQCTPIDCVSEGMSCSCQAEISLQTCTQAGNQCTQSGDIVTLGCWGAGSTPTPTPGGGIPGDTPTPTPTPMALCPNGSCDINEDCHTCQEDCGACPVGTVRARAKKITWGDISCGAVASGTVVTPTTLNITANPALSVAPSAKTQTDGNYVSWPNMPISTTYTIVDTPPAGYMLQARCWQKTGSTGTDQSTTLDLANDTLTWELGYTLAGPWVQAQGGDMYASGLLRSFVPDTATPRQFITNGAGGYPGVATYGSSYNFDVSGNDPLLGASWVSSKNWLAHDTASDADYFQFMYQQFGSPGPTATGDKTLTSRLVGIGSTAPYYYNGKLTINAPAWNIPANDKVVVFVNGDLAINTPITITPGGFIAFIVNGNITVGAGVGEAYTTNPPTPVLEGVYMTARGKTFSDGGGGLRFVGKGMFVGGNFSLSRDMGDAGNPTTSSDLFIYNPQLLFTMPDAMKEMSINWQEVAP